MLAMSRAALVTATWTTLQQLAANAHHHQQEQEEEKNGHRSRNQ